MNGGLLGDSDPLIHAYSGNIETAALDNLRHEKKVNADKSGGKKFAPASVIKYEECLVHAPDVLPGEKMHA